MNTHIHCLLVLSVLMVAGCGKQPAQEQAPEQTATSPAAMEAPQEPVDTQQPSARAEGTMPLEDGFVWHPDASEGRLLVVLPQSYVERVVRCTIEQKTEEGWLELEQGVPHIELGGELLARFRFKMDGASYPAPSYVTAHLSDGSVARWEIQTPDKKHGDASDLIATEAAEMGLNNPEDPEAAEKIRTVSLEDYDVRKPAGGFEWRPGQSHDDNLVVFLPPELKGMVASCFVAVLGPNDWVPLQEGDLRVESGAPRDMYVFPKPGSFYPNHCHVVAKLSDGDVVAWDIRGTDQVHR